MYNPSMETRRGRPNSITPDKSAKLLAALEHGYDLNEAQSHAKISDDAYRRLLKNSGDFAEKVAAAKMKFVMFAKDGAYKKIQQGDGSMIRWVLEHKKPEEYGRQSEELHTGLPPNMTVILPGSKPHPRIIHDPEANPNVRYAFEVEQ